jgi:hypothetical protein
VSIKMKLSFSKIGLVLATPFLAVMIFDGFKVVELLNDVHENSKIGVFMFTQAAFPWNSIFDPIIKEIYVFIGSRSAEPLYIYWLVCTAINTVLVYIAGSSFDLKKLSNPAAILSGLYFIASFLIWVLIYFFRAGSIGFLYIYWYIGGAPFSMFLLTVVGKYGGLIAIIYNTILIYCLASLFSKLILKFKNKFYVNNQT